SGQSIGFAAALNARNGAARPAISPRRNAPPRFSLIGLADIEGDHFAHAASGVFVARDHEARRIEILSVLLERDHGLPAGVFRIDLAEAERDPIAVAADDSDRAPELRVLLALRFLLGLRFLVDQRPQQNAGVAPLLHALVRDLRDRNFRLRHIAK